VGGDFGGNLVKGHACHAGRDEGAKIRVAPDLGRASRLVFAAMSGRRRDAFRLRCIALFNGSRDLAVDPLPPADVGTLGTGREKQVWAGVGCHGQTLWQP
jgi:hypothetical protein